MRARVKNHMENGLSKIFNLRGQNIDMSDQAVFILKDSGLHDEEGKKTNVNSSPEEVRSFFILHDDGPPIPGLSKLKLKSHEL